MSYSLTGYTGYGKRDSARLSRDIRASYGLKHSKARDVPNPHDYRHAVDRKGNARLNTNFPQREAAFRSGTLADQLYAIDCNLIRLCRELTVAENSSKPERVARLTKLIERTEIERHLMASKMKSI